MVKTDTATKITIIGLLVHYSYAVLLLLTSGLTKDLPISISLYLATTAIPLILVCYAALAHKGTSRLEDLEPGQSQEERNL